MKKTDLPARKPVPFGANGSRRDLTAKTPPAVIRLLMMPVFLPLP
ncbi:hypothetical protein [Candidatus Arsenophonus triatominarum]|nr:hypothetical protein [Candidatus Arsenophonus triatominarum]